ncbi:hypothetical protein EXS65_02285 [Candidatus Peribacteria bacterium]|nr:hypothetical protein [Candidatus Peribacteria bacterium]
MRRLGFILFTASIVATMPVAVHAAPSAITFTYGHHLFTISVSAHPEWRTPSERWFYRGLEATPPARFRSCGKEVPIENDWRKELSVEWNTGNIQRTIDRTIGSVLSREAGSVTIDRSASGEILFQGVGLTGRDIDLPLAASLTKTALEQDIAFVELPVIETQPAITVNDPELKNLGIKEVVTIGESVFAKSPVNRRHNIAVGVSKFKGHLIPKGSVFSFNQILGPVSDRTGYWKELVIQGDATIPDYGGGLCQVSTTAYRGPWEYGMPIVQRKNHSYAVSYYSPQGTDATIYPPNVDMKFKNDTPGALLIQTLTDKHDRAFFIYYGTRDNRKTNIVGPYVTDRVSAPTNEFISYTTEIPVGEKRKAGEKHDGMKAMWYREISTQGSGTVLQYFYSFYEARPITFQIGVTAEDMERRTQGTFSDTPSWLPSKP